MAEFISILKKFDGELWYYYVSVKTIDAKPFLGKKDRRVMCSLNGTKPFHCALMPDGDGHFFINVNKERRKKLGIDLDQPVTIELSEDNSEYGMVVPESFLELLSQDEMGNQLFHALTLGRQRTLIYMVAKIKSVDIQIRKSLVILQHLKDQGGQIEYKQLNEDFKKDRR